MRARPGRRRIVLAMLVLSSPAFGACGKVVGIGDLPTTCPGSLTACDGMCVDEQTDHQNCGGCGFMCDPGVACLNEECTLPSGATQSAHCTTCGGAFCSACGGACVDEQTDLSNCGGCGQPCTTIVGHAQAACDAGACTFACVEEYTACGGACVDEQTDPNNCGGCGVVCPPGQAGCAKGECFAIPCVGVYSACGGACVDEQTDPNNCGGCGVVCPPAQAGCANGECFATPCGQGYTSCGGACVDEQTDLSNCGGCGQPCTTIVGHAQAACDAGACTFACVEEYTACGGACVDEQTDPNNCGGCGVVCPPGQAGCAKGECFAICPPGCFQGTPTTDTDFFNACTTAACMPFDNCARLGLCDGGVPALTAPPSAAATPSDAGPPTPPTPPTVGCYDANARSNIIFMQGSANFTPFITAMAPLVAANGGYVIVWQPTSSCAGAGAGGFDTTPGATYMKNPSVAGGSFASYYDSEGTGTPCLLGDSPSSPDGNSEITDIGESDIFANVCPLPAGESPWVPGSAAYPDVGHYLGPIQSMVFVTPPRSSQRAISAEAARMVFGMGGNDGAAAPWTDPSDMLIRGPTTGVNNILSLAIGVPNDKWWGVDTQTAAAMQFDILTSSTDAEKTIGTLSIDYANPVKTSLHILFFQAVGQNAGFLPDSTLTSNDKQNVRDGHYSPWGPIHLYTNLVGGQATAQAAAFIQPFTELNQALIDATIAGGDVPVCAMHVARNQEMGPLQAFTPPSQCGCYFDNKVSGATQCPKCGGPADCPPDLPACNLGYCEPN